MAFLLGLTGFQTNVSESTKLRETAELSFNITAWHQ